MFPLIHFQAAQEEGHNLQAPAAPCHKVTPKPGFCLKTKNDKGEKVFINVCVEESVSFFFRSMVHLFYNSILQNFLIKINE